MVSRDAHNVRVQPKFHSNIAQANGCLVEVCPPNTHVSKSLKDLLLPCPRCPHGSEEGRETPCLWSCPIAVGVAGTPDVKHPRSTRGNGAGRETVSLVLPHCHGGDIRCEASCYLVAMGVVGTQLQSIPAAPMAMGQGQKHGVSGHSPLPWGH